MTRILCLVAVSIFLLSTSSEAERILRASLEQEVAEIGVPFPLVLRLYYDECCIRRPNTSTLEVSGADVLAPTTTNQYEEEIDGVKYGVYELRFMITPKQAGNLSIPKIKMVGEIIEPTRIFSTPLDEAVPMMEVESEPLTIQVRQ